MVTLASLCSRSPRRSGGALEIGLSAQESPDMVRRDTWPILSIQCISMMHKAQGKLYTCRFLILRCFEHRWRRSTPVNWKRPVFLEIISACLICTLDVNTYNVYLQLSLIPVLKTCTLLKCCCKILPVKYCQRCFTSKYWQPTWNSTCPGASWPFVRRPRSDLSSGIK